MNVSVYQGASCVGNVEKNMSTIEHVVFEAKVCLNICVCGCVNCHVVCVMYDTYICIYIYIVHIFSQSSTHSAHLVIFPELFLQGYDCTEETMRSTAITLKEGDPCIG